MAYITPWLQNKANGIVSIKNPVGDTFTETGNPVELMNRFGRGTVDSLEVALNPIQLGSGDPSPSNVRPIIAANGKNLMDVAGRTVSSTTETVNTIYTEACTAVLDGDAVTGTVTGSWSKLRFALDTSTLVDGETYTWSALFDNPSGGTVGVTYNDGAWSPNVTSTATKVKLQTTFTYSSANPVIKVAATLNNTTTNTGYVITVSEMQLERGSFFSQYQPYQGISVERTGKNLLPNQNVIKSGNNYFLCATSNDFPIHLKAGTYTIQNKGVQAYCYGMKQGGSSFTIHNGATYTGTFIVTEEGNYKFWYYQLNVDETQFYDNMLEVGTEATSYEPYTGTQTNVVIKSVINQWDEEWEVGDIDSTTGENRSNNGIWRSINYIPVLPNTSYYAFSPSASYKTLRARFYDSDKNYIGYSPKSGTTYTDRMFVTPDNAFYMRIAPNINDVPNHDISINYPSILTGYYPYGEQSFAVYGGTVDLVSGVLTVTKAMVDLGTLPWAYDSSQTCFYSTVTGMKVFAYGDSATYICDSYKSIAPTYNAGDGQNGTIWARVGYSMLRVRNTAYTDAPTFTTASNGVIFCYELETPTTIQLTPQQISLLTGVNVISTGGDGGMEVTYTLPGWTSLIDPQKLKHDVYDLDAGETTGRNLEGEMLRDRVAVKEKLEMEFPIMYAKDYYTMLNMVKDQFFEVLYFSPYTGDYRIATMYVGDRDGEPYYDYDPQHPDTNKWQNVKFNFIER